MSEYRPGLVKAGSAWPLPVCDSRDQEIERLRARVAVLEKHLGLMIANNLAGSFESEGLATDRAIAVLPDWEEKATGYTRLQLDAAAQIVGLHDEEAKP
jgi:hypothetical protein